MKRITGFFKDIFPSLKALIPAVFIGICVGISIYLGTLQRHFFSKRYLLYALLIMAVSTILVAWLRKRYLTRAFLSLSKAIKIFVLIISVLLSLVLLANTQIQPLYYLLPDTQLEIRIPIREIPEGNESVRLLWIATGQGYVHYTNMHFTGEWERVEKNILFAPNQEVIITWQGKAGLSTEIAFRQTPYDQTVYISWNGVTGEYNLNNPEVPNILIRNQLSISLIYLLPFILSFIVTTAFVIFSLLVLIGTWNPVKRSGFKNKKWTWLLYMLPMLIIWGFSLLVFWPGIMSNDSFGQWTQYQDGQFNDWQSAFYALMLAGFMQIWNSPAFISILQILLLAFLVSWGLKALQDQGVPKIVLWCISLIFAVSPVNNLFTITIWRDIPYAFAVFWLVLILFKVFLSQGEWIKNLGWFWLALAGFLITILRQNGTIVAFSILALLPFIYKKYWKQLVSSFLVCLALFLLFKGPIYNLVNIDRNKSGQSNLILLHHIAAHIDVGTELKPDEQEYLDSFLPTSKWSYYCCYVGTISYDPDFDRQGFLSSGIQTRQLAFELFKRDPLVDIKHMICSGELIWRFKNNLCYMKSIHAFNSWMPGETSWIIPNDAGVKQDSKIPQLVQPYVDLLRVFGFRDDLLVLYLRAALYLYLSVFITAVVAVRFRDFKAWLIGLPILIQSGVLFLIIYAPAFRYQYGIYLAGMFMIGLLFLPQNNPGKS